MQQGEWPPRSSLFPSAATTGAASQPQEGSDVYTKRDFQGFSLVQLKNISQHSVLLRLGWWLSGRFHFVWPLQHVAGSGLTQGDSQWQRSNPLVNAWAQGDRTQHDRWKWLVVLLRNSSTDGAPPSGPHHPGDRSNQRPKKPGRFCLRTPHHLHCLLISAATLYHVAN